MDNSNIKYTSSSIKMTNSHLNIEPNSNTNIKIRYTVPYEVEFSHNDTVTSQTTTGSHPQWYGIQLAKQQLWQEQRVFAHQQCVRFLSSASGDDKSTTYNSTTDDQEGEEVSEELKPSWQFSDLAKQFLQSEQECFANGFAKLKVSVQEPKETEDEKSEWRHEDLARHWERLEQEAFAGSFGRK
ncbi:hypothetical protein KCU65_g4794, partial [Aureobasidium melanogenum]